MGKFIKGDVVVLPFPFSDLSQSKRRPALVLVDLDGDDIILSQITRQSIYDSHAIKILDSILRKIGRPKKQIFICNDYFSMKVRIMMYFPSIFY